MLGKKGALPCPLHEDPYESAPKFVLEIRPKARCHLRGREVSKERTLPA